MPGHSSAAMAFPKQAPLPETQLCPFKRTLSPCQSSVHPNAVAFLSSGRSKAPKLLFVSSNQCLIAFKTIKLLFIDEHVCVRAWAVVSAGSSAPGRVRTCEVREQRYGAYSLPPSLYLIWGLNSGRQACGAIAFPQNHLCHLLCIILISQTPF